MSTIASYTGDGVTRQFDITFTYREQSTIVVTVNGTEVDHSLVSVSRVELEEAPASGAEVRVFRRTLVSEPAKTFTDTAILHGSDLNDAISQPRERVEEIDSEVNDLAGRALRLPAGETALALALPAERKGKYLGFSPDDGSPLLVDGTTDGTGGALALALAAAAGAGLVGWKADGGGAVVRQLAARLKDLPVSVKDFGAVGDGVADDTAAINAAIATLTAGKTLYFPAGDYKVSHSTNYFALTPIPIGANVTMEPQACLKVYETSLALQIITPLGSNVLTNINIDGRCLPEASTVQSGAWQTFSHTGIRAAFDPAHGAGSVNVTIIGGNLRNLDYGIQTWGAQGWQVKGVRSERLKHSAQLYQYGEGYSCLFNRVIDCHSDQTGDTSVAFVQAGTDTASIQAYNSVIGCSAEDWCLRTQGAAFDCENRSDGDVSKQHHCLFASLTGKHNVTGLPHGVGGAVMNCVTKSSIVNCTFTGSLNSLGDIGILMSEGTTDSLMAGNTVTYFRGAGLSTDGSHDATVDGNTVVDCGSNSSAYPAIAVATTAPTTGARVLNNYVKINADYIHASLNSIGIAVRALTFPVSDIEVRGNKVVSPWGVGVRVQGAAGFVVDDVEVTGNKIIASSTAVPVAEPAEPIQLLYVNEGRVGRNVLKNVRYGYTLTNCTKVQVHDGEIKGAAVGVLGLYNFAGSTGIEVKRMRCRAPVGTVTLAAGTGSQWEDDDKVAPKGKGSVATTTDASGDVTVTHSLGMAPEVIIANATGTTFATVQPHTKGASTFKLRFFNAAGAVIASSAVTADWAVA